MKNTIILFALVFLTTAAWSQAINTIPEYEHQETFIEGASVPFGLANNPPVLTEISDLQVFERPNGILINWNSLRETNNGGFEVLRSEDGQVWSVLEFIPGQNESHRAYTEYQFFDDFPYQGESYYMLRKIYLDGTSAYSPAIKINYIGNVDLSYNFMVYPNPVSASSELFVQLEDAKEPVNMDMFDMNGQRVDQFMVSQYKTSVDLGDLTPGTYVLRSEINGFPYSKKLVVK